MSDWVNWQDFAQANKPDAAAQAQQEADRASMMSALDKLGTESMSGAAHGGSENLSDYGSYAAVQRQGQQAQQRHLAKVSDTWDRLTDPEGASEANDPWADLDSRLSGIQTGVSSARAGYDTRKQQDRLRRQSDALTASTRQTKASQPVGAAPIGSTPAAYAAYSQIIQNGGTYEDAMAAFRRAGGSGDNATAFRPGQMSNTPTPTPTPIENPPTTTQTGTGTGSVWPSEQPAKPRKNGVW